jgi:hypothetical protein
MPAIFVLSLALAVHPSPWRDCDDAANAILVRLQAATARNIKAQKNGDIEEDVTSLREIIASDIEMSNHCPQNGKYDLYDSGMDKTRLAIILGGQHKLAEAEDMFRSADTDYKNSKVAGNDTYSDHDLPFAYLLHREGKAEESSRICAYWKHRVSKIGKDAVNMARNSEPQFPPYDDPEQQVGRWTLFCADEKTGIEMLTTQINQHPQMLAPALSLGNYYILNGDFQKARDLETEWHGRLANH